MGAGTCLRCGAPYEPDDTVCYSCGAPIGESESPTQPVPAVRAQKASTSAPLAQPSEPLPAAIQATTPVSAPVIARPARPAANEAPAKKRRVPVFLLACVVFLIAIGGVAYAIRVLNAPPPVATQATYTDPQHRFSFVRPALWVVTQNTQGVTVSDASGASTAKIQIITSDTVQSAATYADSQAQALGLSPAQKQTIGGEQWEERTGQVTGTDGAVRQTTLLVTIHAGQLYVIQLSSPIASYSGIDTLVYEPLLASFTFGGQ